MRAIFKQPAPAPICAYEFVYLVNNYNLTEQGLATALRITERDVRTIVENINENKYTDIDTRKMLFKRINTIYYNVIGSDLETKSINKLRTDLQVASMRYKHAREKSNQPNLFQTRFEIVGDIL